MATPDIETYNKYYGNGETTEFSVSFPYSKREYVKVYVRRVGFEQVSVDPKDYEFVNDKTIRYPSNTSSDDILRDGDIITIQRETTVASEFIFSNQKRLFPEDVMDADDLAFEILQEQKRELGRAIIVDPTSEVQPKVLLEKVDLVYNRIDDIETVSRNIDSVDNVSKNIDSVSDVSAIKEEVKDVSDNMGAVLGVHANESSINTVSENDAGIRLVAGNIDAVLDAPNQAESARQSAQFAKQEADRAEINAAVVTYRNIGDIFFTTRLDTELNGAVECNGATYNTNDFTGEQAIGNLLNLGKLPYVSLDEYQTAIDTNGSCRAFGWDGGDSFRVPTIPALLLTKEQASVVGNGMSLGWTNGTMNAAMVTGGQYENRDAFVENGYGTDIATYVNSGNRFPASDRTIGITTDPTKSGIVANLDTVQYRAMVQLANEATDEALITATSALQQVANKVDKTSATDRQTVVGWGMPDYTAGISIANNETYTAPCDGVYIGGGSGNNGMVRVTLYDENDSQIFQIGNRYAVDSRSGPASVVLPVPKGYKIRITDYNNGVISAFYPLTGAN